MLRAAEELDYHPNLIASNFVHGKSGNIAVVIPYIPNVHIFSVFYFSEILSGIGEVLKKNGLGLLLSLHTPGDSYIDYFRDGRTDGCILLGTRRDDLELINLKEKGCMFCLINNYIPSSGISFIDADNISGSYNAVKFLVELGHREIGFLNGPDYFTNSIDREKGFQKAMDEFGLKIVQSWMLKGNYGKKSGYEAGIELFKEPKLPSAILASNDRMAAGFIQSAKERGLKIPCDISIIGYDDSDICTIVEPQMTSVRIPFYEMGKRCAEKYINMIQNSNESFEVFIETELSIRKSVYNKVDNLY